MIDQLIWNWLPARPDRRRTTQPSIIAANLGLPTSDVTAALARMERQGHAICGRRGSWHRGLPLPEPDTLTNHPIGPA